MLPTLLGSVPGGGGGAAAGGGPLDGTVVSDDVSADPAFSKAF